MHMAAAPPPPPTPTVVEPLPIVPVVGPQFCEPSTLVLTVTKKAFSFSGGDFTVSDASSRKIMQVGRRPCSIPVETCAIRYSLPPIISMRHVMSLRSRGTWKVYRGDSSDPRELLFTVKRSSIIQLTTKLDVFLAENITQQRCDFKVKASWFGSSYTFYLGDSDTVIAIVERQYELKNMLLSKKTYSVTVYPNVDYAFVVSIVVILAKMESSKKN